jgi:hypothetical protein
MVLFLCPAYLVLKVEPDSDELLVLCVIGSGDLPLFGGIDDLSVLGVVGDLSVLGVVGDLSVFGVAGDLSVLKVVGDLSVLGVMNDLSVLAVIGFGDISVFCIDVTVELLLLFNNNVVWKFPPVLNTLLETVEEVWFSSLFVNNDKS